MWVEGYKDSKNTTDLVDVNAELKQLKGELDEETTRLALAKFLMYNIGFTTRILTGFSLEAYQRLLIKGWFKKNNALCVAGRGGAKTTIASVFAYLYCLFNPDHTVIIVSATFRSSRSIVENIEKWSQRKEGALLRQTFKGDIQRRADEYKVNFLNGSQIIALPLGDSNRLRGFRTNVLIIDEGLLIPEQTIEMVLRPFLSKASDIHKKQKIVELEDKLVAQGKMTDAERTKFPATSKMIILSSASYQWESLYTRYKNYLKTIHDSAELKETPESTYLIQQFSWEIIPKHILDAGLVNEITSGQIPQSIVDREYRAIFTQNSDGYYSAKKMAECTIEDGEEPCAEIVGDDEDEYVLGIDPNMSASDAADHFAMCLLKVARNKNGKKIGMVVHQYACAGVELKDHIEYLHYLIDHFNIVYIACDTSQGNNLDFINICNESELFKTKRIQLNPIAAEFGKEDIYELTRQVSVNYNKTTNNIVHKQFFHAAFQRAANEYLKSCFDFQNILFAGKIKAHPSLMQAMALQKVGDIYKTHEGFKEASMHCFVEQQDYLMDLVKRECALIEPSMSKLGSISYDLPSTLKRNKNPNRTRKDSYSALLLANWALKIYVDARDLPIEDKEEFNPVLL